MSVKVELTDPITEYNAIRTQPIVDADIFDGSVFSIENTYQLAAGPLPAGVFYVVLDFSAVSGSILLRPPKVTATNGPITLEAFGDIEYSDGTPLEGICRHLGKATSNALLVLDPTISSAGGKILEAILPAGPSWTGSSGTILAEEPYILPPGSIAAIKMTNQDASAPSQISYALIWDELGDI